MTDAALRPQAPEATEGLEAIGLRAGYGETEVVRGVSLSARRGSGLALLGANGAGKTTLLNVISGGVAARSGSIAVNGVDITRTSASGRARLGLCHIPEGRGIFRSLTVRENIQLHAGHKPTRTLTWHIPPFPCWANGKNRSQARFPGVSSRCWHYRGPL